MIPTRVGLLGWPVAHSRSPAMHRAAFQAMGLDWEYELLPVPPEHLADAIRRLRGPGWAGANVTVPHKQAAMAHLDAVTPDAQAIGAVNTIVSQQGHLIGHNTDAPGFLAALREVGVEPCGIHTLVLGAGGAARAVVWALLTEGATVTLANRSPERATALAAEFGASFPYSLATIPLAPAPLSAALADATLLVNTTSVGMHPAASSNPLPGGVSLPASLAVYDLVYAPRETRLMAQARVAGAPAWGGLGMLVHQGALAFALWTSRPAPLEVMRVAASG